MANVDFTEEKENFRSAKYGKDVRESLIDIAEAVETACNNQLITVDSTLSRAGQGADAKAVGDEINELRSAITDGGNGEVNDALFSSDPLYLTETIASYRLNPSDGYCSWNTDYNLLKYAVTAGTRIRVKSDDRFQFQNASATPTGTTVVRVGDKTYGEGDFILTVPSGATWLILTTPVSGSTANVYAVTDLGSEVTRNVITPIFHNGTINNHLPDFSSASYSKQWLVTGDIMHVKAGSYIKRVNTTMYIIIESYDSTGTWIERLYAGNLSTNYVFTADAYIRIATRNTDYALIVPSTITANYSIRLISADGAIDKVAKIAFIGLGAGSGYSSGQAQLIQLPNGKNLLIDSHLMQSYTAFYYMLRNRGVRHIDYYVQSHYHSDHTGIINLMTQSTMENNIDITGMTAFLPMALTESAISHISGDTPSTLVDRQTQLTEILNNNSCTIVRPSDGDKVDLGDGITLEFYNCDHSVYSDSSGSYYSRNYNDWSLCCYLDFGLNAINFAADLGPIGQRKVGGTLRKANIMTAPHHGWDNGANNLIPAFINNVNPDTVISVNGWEHHPDNESSPANMMLATSPMQTYCEANGVPNYPTCTNGAIDIIMNKYGWKFNGIYTKYIRNGKNWKYSDNTDKQE